MKGKLQLKLQKYKGYNKRLLLKKKKKTTYQQTGQPVGNEEISRNL